MHQTSRNWMNLPCSLSAITFPPMIGGQLFSLSFRTKKLERGSNWMCFIGELDGDRNFFCCFIVRHKQSNQSNAFTTEFAMNFIRKGWPSSIIPGYVRMDKNWFCSPKIDYPIKKQINCNFYFVGCKFWFDKWKRA